MQSEFVLFILIKVILINFIHLDVIRISVFVIVTFKKIFGGLW